MKQILVSSKLLTTANHLVSIIFTNFLAVSARYAYITKTDITLPLSKVKRYQSRPMKVGTAYEFIC